MLVHDWAKIPLIQLPIVPDSMPKAKINNLNVACAECGKPLEGLRGKVIEHQGNCIEIEGSGACYQCRLITPFHVRWYPKQGGRMLQCNDDGMWKESDKNSWQENDASIFRIIMRFARVFLGKMSNLVKS